MWLMTTCGFFSIVRHARQPDTFLIRTRRKEDLQAALTLLGEQGMGWEILATPENDYPFRLLVSGAQKDAFLAALGAGIDYSNFKSEVARTPGQRHKLDAYHDVWATMRRTQERS